MLSLTQGLLVHFQGKDELGGGGLDYCSTSPPHPWPFVLVLYMYTYKPISAASVIISGCKDLQAWHHIHEMQRRLALYYDVYGGWNSCMKKVVWALFIYCYFVHCHFIYFRFAFRLVINIWILLGGQFVPANWNVYSEEESRTSNNLDKNNRW